MTKENSAKLNLVDKLSLAIATFGVGYIPIAPGTWGSACGVLIYLLIRQIEYGLLEKLLIRGFQHDLIIIWINLVNTFLLVLFCFFGILCSTQASRIFQKKDPSEVVVDEVMGQLITFIFVPFNISWWTIFLGFLFFRLFDIWKPYPIDDLQELPNGLGICMDDILSGVYAGICICFYYAMQISF